MTTKTNGGAAFPVADHPSLSIDPGMTLRDYFAATAMQGLLANPGGPVQRHNERGWDFVNCELEEVATTAFAVADVMLAARIVSEAAQQEAKREFIAQQEKESWRHVYKPLFSLGWFHNPRVIAAYGVDPRLPPQERIELIGRAIYDCFDIESLTELEPQYFVAACDAMGIRDTLPTSVIEAARGST